MNKPITSFRGEYAFLSNFYNASVVLDGISYPTVENAYQAAKTLHHPSRVPFETVTPTDAKRLGKSLWLRPDWEQCNLRIMWELLQQKFAPGTYLAERLLETGNLPICEDNYWHDNFWGDCVCARCSGLRGYNHLGVMLMHQRALLRERQ